MPFIAQHALTKLKHKAGLLDKYRKEWEERKDLEPNPDEIATLVKYPNGGDFCEQYLERGKSNG